MKFQTGKIGLLLLLLFPLMSIIYSCKKDKLLTSGFKLEFDTDTLLFDTLFTNLAPSPFPQSVYKILTVRNRNKERVKFNIKLAGGKDSPFRMNVDGQAATEVLGYELMGEDSIFLFVEVYIKPNNQNNPAVITDSLIFEGGIKTETVKLVAWGWDAHYFNRQILNKDSTWTDDKPIVIYNYFAVNENVKLTIEPGTKVYTHSKGGLYVFGTLEAKGDTNNPIIFQGDRLEWSYRNVDAQWKGIEFAPGSVNNIMSDCIVKNGVIGIQVDSVPINGNYNLILDRVQVRNMSQVGILGYHCKLKATNTLVGNCGLYTLVGPYGGQYDLNHCTFASFNQGNGFNRKSAHFGFSNQPLVYANNIAYSYPLAYHVENCIIYGDQDDEIEIGKDLVNGGMITDSTVIYSFVKAKKYEGNYTAKTGCRVNEDPLFNEVSNFDFMIKKNSPAKGAANKNANTPLIDLTGFSRDAEPDAGCYEARD
jgi:hypothetical protein